MSLIDFTLIPPIFSPERIGKAIASIIPLSVMEQAITETSSQQERERMLPTPVIIFLVMSLNFWSGDSVVDVFKNLVEGFMSELIPQKIRLKIPSSGSRARSETESGSWCHDPFISSDLSG